MLTHFGPDSLVPFPSYRTPRSDARGFLRGAPELCPTAAHFYFSEYYRGSNELERLAILELPSAGEARKIIGKAPPKLAWIHNQERILATALWKQFLQLPDLPRAIASGALPLGLPTCLGKGWEPRHGGMERWARVVNAVISHFQSPTLSLLILGSTPVHNPFFFATKLALLLSNRLPDQVLITGRPGTESMAELWAIENYIPAIHSPALVRPTPADKLAAIQKLATKATHTIVFSVAGEAYSAKVKALMAELQIPTRTVLIDKDGRPVVRSKPTVRSNSR